MLGIQKATKPISSNHQDNSIVSRFAVAVLVALVVGFTGIILVNVIPDFAAKLFRVFQEGALIFVLLLVPGAIIGAMVNHFRKRGYI